MFIATARLRFQKASHKIYWNYCNFLQFFIVNTDDKNPVLNSHLWSVTHNITSSCRLTSYGCGQSDEMLSFQSDPWFWQNWVQRFVELQCTLNSLWSVIFVLADVERTSSESLPGPFDNYSLGVYRHPIVHLRNNPGFQNSGLNKYPHNHMIFLTNTYNLTYEQQTAFGIMSMFSTLLALAMDRGFKLGEHLKEPLVTKCLVTDGIQFTSMCYQLNTLSFQEDIGIKNCAWVSPNMNLFSKQEKTSARAWSILYESLEKGEQVSGFNDMCFKTILALFCHHWKWVKEC